MNQRYNARGGIWVSLLLVVLMITAGLLSACRDNTLNKAIDENRPNEPQTLNPRKQLLTGQAANSDWTTDAPGVRRKLPPADMPPPYATLTVTHHPQLVGQPAGAMPQVPVGFRVTRFASNLTNPRMIRTAPNGDLFVVESQANRVRIL